MPYHPYSSPDDGFWDTLMVLSLSAEEVEELESKWRSSANAMPSTTEDAVTFSSANEPSGIVRHR